MHIQCALIQIFKNWGIPRWIKVDNGRPFGDPQRQTVPVLALWLTALGIQVIFNRPRIPQDNAKVERSQRVLSNWTEWHKCANAAELQHRLWKEADFHNMTYPVSRLDGKTRREAFPGLSRSDIEFNPENFELQRALDLLAQGHWQRVVSINGQIDFWGIRIRVGKHYARQFMSIKLDPKQNLWMIFNPQGAIIKVVETSITDQKLWKLDLS